MDLKKAQAFGERLLPVVQGVGDDIATHSRIVGAVLGVVLLYAFLVWRHFKVAYGPKTWALSEERHKALRGSVHVAVWPLRLLASLFSGFVALLLIAVLVGFGYVIWKMMMHR